MTERPESSRSDRDRSARVVVLEPDALAREIVVRRLRRRLGVEVDSVESASAAIEFVERDADVCAAVLDVEVAGVAAFRRLRAFDRTLSLIACGSSIDERVRASLSDLGLGSGHVFTKPFRFGDLLRAIRLALADGNLGSPRDPSGTSGDGYVAKSP